MRITLLTVIILLNTNLAAQDKEGVIADSLFATGNYTKAINAYASLGTVPAGLQIARAYSAIGNYDKPLTSIKQC